MKSTRSVVGRGLALIAGAIAACTAPVAPRPDGPAEPRFELTAYDARGLGMPLDALARRPEFVLASTRALESVALVLLTGEPNPDLLEDLAAPPLRAAHDERVVPSVALQAYSRLRLTPRVALASGASYTLALPGNARVQNGAALGRGGPAFVARLRTLGSAAAGAAWLAALPAAGSSGVPPNLAAAYVVLDGAAEGIEAGIWLESQGGASVPAAASAVDCAALDSRGKTCVELSLSGPLEPRARYRLRSGRALHDSHGAPIEPLSAEFETGAAADRVPPLFEPLGCLPDEQEAAFGCLLAGDGGAEIRLRADESVRVVVRSWERQERSWKRQAGAGDGPGASTGTAAAAGAVAAVRVLTRMSSVTEPPLAAQLTAAADATLRVDGLKPDAPFELKLLATDLAGNTTEAHVEAATTSALAPLSITEVLADPDGPDAAQEYVEVENFGEAPAPLRGVMLADANDLTPSVISSDTALPARSKALLVADDFDPSAAKIPPGTRLVRLGPSLTKNGLANAGEQLFLRDAEKHRLSAVPMRAASVGRCLQRRTADPRSAAPGDFIEGVCTPGR